MPTPGFISSLKADRCVHYLNNTVINRAQAVDLNANVPTEVIDELGNQNHAGVVSAPAEVTLSVTVYDTGVELCRSLTGKSAAASFSLGDFSGAQVDYVGVVRDNNETFFRSVYVKNAAINSLGYGFDTAGNATETYGLIADNLTVFDGFVLTKTYTVLPADVTNGYFTLPLQGAEAPIQTKANSYFAKPGGAGAYLLRVTKSDGAIVRQLYEDEDYTFDPATKRLTAGGLAAGQVWTVVFYSAVAGTPLAPVFNAATPPAVRGEFTPVSIGLSSKTLIPRLQAAKISVNLQQKPIHQLGSRRVLYAPAGAPGVSGNFSVLMNDLSLRKLLTYGQSSSTETQFGIEQLPAYGAQNNLGLEAVIKSPVDNSVLKRVTVADIVVSNGGMPANVNGVLAETFAWTGRRGAMTIANS